MASWTFSCRQFLDKDMAKSILSANKINKNDARRLKTLLSNSTKAGLLKFNFKLRKTDGKIYSKQTSLLGFEDENLVKAITAKYRYQYVESGEALLEDLDKYKELNFDIGCIYKKGFLVIDETKPPVSFDRVALLGEDEDEDGDYQEEMTDVSACRKLMLYLNLYDFEFVNCKDKLYFYNPDEGIWTDQINIIRQQIELCNELPLEYRGSTNKRDKIMKELVVCAERDDDFMLKAQPSTYRKLAFNNCIYDFELGKTIPFSSEYIFFNKLSIDFDSSIATGNPQLEKQIDDKIIYGTFGKVRGEYYKKIIARALAGEVYDKLFGVIIGLGNSGKGVNCELLEKAFGRFVGTFNAGALCRKTGVVDDAKAKSWLIPLCNKRIAICSEIPIGSQLDAGMIKSFASGGDTLTARQNYQNETEFKIQATPLSFLNDMPEIRGADDAINNRMKYIETQYVYLKPEDYELRGGASAEALGTGIRLADPEIKQSFINQDDVVSTFIHMILKAYELTPPSPPDEVIKESKEWTSNSDIQERIKDLFEVVENKEECVSCSALHSHITHQGIDITKTKLGKLMKSQGFSSKQKRINGKVTDVYLGIKLSSSLSTISGDY